MPIPNHRSQIFRIVVGKGTGPQECSPVQCQFPPIRPDQCQLRNGADAANWHRGSGHLAL